MRVSCLLFLASLTTSAASLQRHRLQQNDQHKEVTSSPTLAADRLVPNAINENGDACSCSPTKFTFRLALSQDCSTDDIEANAGIESTYCTIDEPSGDQEPIRRLQGSTPVEITSVQYLEFEPGTLEVMYTDDSYLNTSLTDGDTLTFYSASSYLPVVSPDEQEDYVPGGVSLIITGKTEDGTDVRNRFYWLYDDVTTDCLENLETPGVYKGDAIGWVVTDKVSGPWPQFCPAASPTSPTINPRTFTPTSSPAGLPYYGFTSSKSSKGYGESSKSSKSVVSKSSKNSEVVEVDAKADKHSGYSGKSSKSTSYHTVGSFSMSMSESASSAPTGFMSHGTIEYDSKAVKNSEYRMFSSKSTKGSSEAVFSKAGKSSKSATESMSNSISMSYSPSAAPSESARPTNLQVPSAAPSESSYPTLFTHSINSTKSGKSVEADSKAEKYSSSKSSESSYILRHTSAKALKEPSSKSGKSAFAAPSYSMSIPSAAPSESARPTDLQPVDTKAKKYSAKAYRLMQPKSAKGTSNVSSNSSKGSKAEVHPIGSVSMSYSSTIEPASELSSKSSKGYQVVKESSLSYSMSMHSSESSKSAKATSGSGHQNIRGLKSERTAGDLSRPNTTSPVGSLETKAFKAKSSKSNKMIDPSNEEAWAEYALMGVVSKAGKNDSSQSLSMHTLTLSNSTEAASNNSDHANMSTSKSSKSEHIMSSKSAKSDYLTNGSKSSKSQHSYSYSLSAPSKETSPEKADSSLTTDTLETRPQTTEPASSGFDTSSRESNPSQIRTASAASSLTFSKMAAFVIFTLQLAVESH